ncbi:MAG: hypothetical protein Q7T21_15795 [Gallionella sp.]|nr:hypothetical protein [Gallionella sp.]
MISQPKPLAPIFENFPPILTAQPSWVMWSYAIKEGKWTKVPKQPGGYNASSTNPATWSTFDSVRIAYQRGGFDGVGIALTGQPLENGFYIIGLDFDDCLTGGVLDNDSQKAVEQLDTYWEISPSSEGIRLFLLHNKPIMACKINVAGKSREIYSSGRYLTVTGHIIGRVKAVRHVA